MGWGMAALTVTQTPWLTLSMARGSEVKSSAHPVSNLPLKLKYLLNEHSEIMNGLSRAKYDGADLQRSSSALEANNNQLADLASRLYGERGRGVFLQLWKEHNLEILNYAEAVKLDDQIKQEKARQDLERITTQMREAITSANPDYPIDEFSGLINEHLKLTLELIDTYPQKTVTIPEVEEKKKAISASADKIAEFIVQNL